MDEFREAAPKGVEFELQIPEQIGTVTGDPVMLREAIRNLVDNSYRHGGHGLTQVVLSGSQKGNRIEISVQDNGTGLEANQIEKAAERFVGYSTSSGGGLGLAIVSEIAKGHGGRLVLETNENGLRSSILINE